MDADLITTALGPVWSNNCTKIWSLLLAPDRIIAWPYTFVESFTFALRLQPRFWPRDPGAAFRCVVGEGIAESDLPRDRQPRRYHVHLLRSIVLQSNNAANTITFEKLSGGVDVYAIALRRETDDSRVVFGELYPEKYKEKDFPTSAIGLLLRK